MVDEYGYIFEDGRNGTDNRLIDLHMHTDISDGSESPEEVVHRAQSRGISAMAITDHDNVAGVKRAVAEGALLGIEVIPGIEMTTNFYPEMHILGLFIDIDNKNLIYEINRIQRKRKELFIKALRLVKRYAPESDIFSTFFHSVKVITLKGLIEYLAENEVISDKETGSRICKKIITEWQDQLLTPQGCINLIHDCNGLAFLAHPIQLNCEDSELKRIVKGLQENGLDGIEILHPNHTPEDTLKYSDWCKELGLLYSGGSDYHGNILYRKNEIKIPYTFLEAMKKRLKE